MKFDQKNWISEMLSIQQGKWQYPRPQLRRSCWMCLNGKWKFTFDDSEKFAAPDQITSWPMKILVPFAPESEMSGIHDTGFHSRFWYQREVELALPSQDERVLLHFAAVDY